MKDPIQLTKAMTPVRHILCHSPWRRDLVISVMLACFALSPIARAACGEGCDPNLNTFLGEDALFSLTTGAGNTAIGWQALFYNTTGGGNTAGGSTALHDNETGGENTATGDGALFSNTIGNSNTATGANALLLNTTGSGNTASGEGAMQHFITGSNNTANGFEALFGGSRDPSTGSFNTANGVQALYSDTSGGSNTANGYYALYSNTTGGFNAANGANALQYNTTGGGNVANGGFALFVNTTGMNNVAEGFDALFNNTTGSSNIGIGLGAGGSLTTGSNNIDIGNAGVAGESKTIRIGTGGTHAKTFIAGISGVTVAGGVGVIVGSNGKLGTVVSSARFKDEIKPMEKASEALLALQPVMFRYKHEFDPDGIPQFGLIAEQVEKVNPDLVARDEQGKPYTVRYDAVNAMLLNEFLKEHRKVEKLQASVVQQQKHFQAAITEQQQEIKTLAARLEERAAQIQKVNAQLAVASSSFGELVTTKSSPQIVLNNQ